MAIRFPKRSPPLQRDIANIVIIKIWCAIKVDEFLRLIIKKQAVSRDTACMTFKISIYENIIYVAKIVKN